MTIGIYEDYYAKKIGYIKTLQDNKIVILAGSNGRFSHRCETIENVMNIPCVNMSISATLSLKYQLEKLKPYLLAGDIVYLPLEYFYYTVDKAEENSADNIPLIVAYEHDVFFNLNIKEKIQALMYFDMIFLISAAGEMLLDKAGVKRRYSVDTMTKQGDEAFHTDEKAIPYEDYIQNLYWEAPDANYFKESGYQANILEAFLYWSDSNNIEVIGGLPTTFDDTSVADQLIVNVCQFYKNRQQHFFILENKSQYPREKFYDTPNHLREHYQIKHSLLLAELFSNFFTNKITHCNLQTQENKE